MGGITTEDCNTAAAAAARKGFTLLGAHGPGGWREDIDLSALDMGSPEACLLGQVYREFTRGATLLFLEAGLIDDPDGETNMLVRAYGFMAPFGSYMDGSAYEILAALKQAWVTLLTAGE